MSEVKKIATRDSYGAALVELAKDHPDVVVLDADLAAATKTGVFKKAYPDRHFDCGIAESNMMATAAGMAAMGLVPFASSFAMFAAGRAFEPVHLGGMDERGPHVPNYRLRHQHCARCAAEEKNCGKCRALCAQAGL